MKNHLPLVLFILMACGLLGGIPEARASHLLGGDMTYVSLGNNQYRVKCRFYRDCSGITLGPFTLECRNGGCNATASVTAPFVQQGAVEAGNPFCAAASAGPCQGPTGLPNYDVYNYIATVTLPPGSWTLSTGQNSRPAMANIAGGDLYVEATLDNRNSPTGAAVANNSPQFDPQDIPVQYVCWKQPTTITYSSTEADGDSLVYSLTAPLQACGVPVSYNSFAAGGPATGIITPNAQCPTCPLCVFQYTAPTGVFSPTYPIQVGVDTIGNCPLKTGQARAFTLNQQARTVTFAPAVYIANTNAALGLNKYQVAVLVTEYRRINGVRRIIGTVRRETTLVVTDCGANNVPNMVATSNQTVNSGTVTPHPGDSTLAVYACSYLRVLLNFTDPDNLRTPSANQLLTVTMPTDINTNPNLLDSGDVGSFILTGNGTPNPRGTFFFQPSPSTVGHIIRINIKIEDNACPIKGVQNRVLVFRIRQGNFAAVIAGVAGSTPSPICAGSSLALQGAALRADSVRRLATGATVLQTYGYHWTVRGDGLAAAQVNTQSISVTPTVTSRYSLTITPTSGYGPGCGDTTSVLVRVLPPVPAPVVMRSGNTLSSSAATGNQWFRDNQLLAGATSQTLLATTNGAYAVQRTVVTGAVSCLSALSAPLAVLATQRVLPGTSLSVLPNPTPDGRLNVVFTGYRQPIELTLFDALGRTVAHASVASPNPQGTTQTLDLATLRTGLYVLQVRTANSLEMRQVVRE